MGFMDNLRRGLERSRETLSEIFYMGGEVTEDFWDDLEDTLVMGDMGAEVAMRVTDDLRERAARENLMRSDQLRRALVERLTAEFPVAERDPFTDTPSIVLFVGINGAGKTTTVGKIAGRAHASGIKTLIGGADTFRAAAVEQIQIWGDRVGVPVVKQQMGADPASVAFDTLQSAKANGADVVIIDTAGRLHNKIGLMNELKKIKDVMKKVVPEAPHEVLLVLDGSTGQNAFEQARQFAAVTQITSLAITKLDGTAKGGVVIGISDQLKVPVKYIGLGEGMEDLQLFDKVQFVDSLFK